VVVDRRTVTEGDVGEQGAVPEYVLLYRPASGLPRQAVVWLARDGATGRRAQRTAQHRGAERLSVKPCTSRIGVPTDQGHRAAPQDQLVGVDSWLASGIDTVTISCRSVRATSYAGCNERTHPGGRRETRA
jgi:hypothetical protein